MATFEIAPAHEGGGFWMWMACEFGGDVAGHWLALADNGGGVIVQPNAYVWKTSSAAFWARDMWEHQQQEG